jgi:CubicO group peptidase (beta-lactamase class C family)
MLRSLLLLCVWLPGRLAAAEPPVQDAEKLVATALKTWNVPGAAVVIVRGDDRLLLKGFGVRSLGDPAPVGVDTQFPLASCTKAFTTTLLAMLDDDGTMHWDDSPRKHFPEFSLSDPNANALLTVRDLLCHRCGIGGHDVLWYHAPWSIDETLKRAGALPLDYPFRGGFQYSSIPYLVAGRACEKRTGEKWEKLVRARICDPLGMKGVSFTTRELPADAARGHKLGKNGKPEPVPRYEIREPNPAGSINLSARDLEAWLKFHLSDGLDPNGTRLVSVRNLEETRTPHNVIRLDGLAKALNPDTVQLSYALGWLVYDHRGKKVVSHGGMIDGFRVQVTLLPGENLGIAVLANLQETRMNAALVNSLIDLYCRLPARNWNEFFLKVVEQEAADRKASLEAREKARNPNAKPTLALAGYSGKYTHPAYGVAEVIAANGKLSLTWSSFTCPLAHFEGDTFRVESGFFEERLVTFEVKDGRTRTLTFTEQKFQRQGE